MIAIHFNPVILFYKYFITFVFFRFNMIQRELRLRRGWEKWQDIETAGSSNLGLFKHIPRRISQKLFTCQHAAFQSWSLIRKKWDNGVYNGQQRDPTAMETVMACQYWYQKMHLVLQKLYKASVHSPSDPQSKSKSFFSNFQMNKLKYHTVNVYDGRTVITLDDKNF